eukprot:760969-Hanusia_phi.AAC.1
MGCAMMTPVAVQEHDEMEIILQNTRLNRIMMSDYRLLQEFSDPTCRELVREDSKDSTSSQFKVGWTALLVEERYFHTVDEPKALLLRSSPRKLPAAK